jgi:hypothetical protein
MISQAAHPRPRNLHKCHRIRTLHRTLESTARPTEPNNCARRSFSNSFLIPSPGSATTKTCHHPRPLPVAPRTDPRHVRGQARSPAEARRVDGRRAHQHRRAAERQCRPRPRRRRWRPALHGPDVPPHHAVDARPGRVEARAVDHPGRRAPDHQARGHHGPVRGAGQRAVRHHRDELRLLLLYLHAL